MHVVPYGEVNLDMTFRLDLAAAVAHGRQLNVEIKPTRRTQIPALDNIPYVDADV